MPYIGDLLDDGEHPLADLMRAAACAIGGCILVGAVLIVDKLDKMDRQQQAQESVHDYLANGKLLTDGRYVVAGADTLSADDYQALKKFAGPKPEQK